MDWACFYAGFWYTIFFCIYSFELDFSTFLDWAAGCSVFRSGARLYSNKLGERKKGRFEGRPQLETSYTPICTYVGLRDCDEI